MSAKDFLYSHHIGREYGTFFKKIKKMIYLEEINYHVSTPKGHVLFIGQTYSACLHFMWEGFRFVLCRVKCVL